MDNKICILVLDRGWVKVGRIKRHPELAFHWKVEDAYTVRSWGTEHGIEQLAREGPLSNTVLDGPATVHVPFRAVIMIMDCVEEKWTHLWNKPSGAQQKARITRP